MIKKSLKATLYGGVFTLHTRIASLAGYFIEKTCAGGSLSNQAMLIPATAMIVTKTATHVPAARAPRTISEIPFSSLKAIKKLPRNRAKAGTKVTNKGLRNATPVIARITATTAQIIAFFFIFSSDLGI